MLGLREVTKHLKLKKLKLVIISPNLEKIQSKGMDKSILRKMKTAFNSKEFERCNHIYMYLSLFSEGAQFVFLTNMKISCRVFSLY